MTDLDLATVTIDARDFPSRLAWAHGQVATFPVGLALTLRSPNAARDPSIRSRSADAARDLRLHAAFTPRPPLVSRLPVSYRSVPSGARRLVAAAVGRVQRIRQQKWARFPRWPLDLSADIAADLAGMYPAYFERTPVLLTHDIDSPEGLQNLESLFLPIEEGVEARSANYVVPCAWPLDHGVIAHIRDRGHEIGVHGYDHANRTAFADSSGRQRRLSEGHAIGRRYGATGYRAPSLLRTPALLADLASFYRYDSSIPTSGGPFPAPNNGCATARPWKVGPLWEVPISLPRDGSLRFLGYDPDEIATLWREAASLIAAAGGIVCLLTHCETGFSGNPAMLTAYRRTVEWFAADGRFMFMRPTDLVAKLEAMADAARV